MNKFFITMSILSLLSLNATSFGMEQSNNILSQDATLPGLIKHKDLGKQITIHLPKEDLNDLRLVNKELATKGPHWQFMPDAVENEYDKIIKKHGTINKLHKAMITYSLTSNNDIDSIKWILNSTKVGTKINNTHSISLYANESINLDYNLYPCMLAIHNNNPELARLLIEKENDFQDKNWKSYYQTITAPEDIQHCLYLSHSRDFSFIPYIVTIWSDDSAKLKELYSQKIPTDIGTWILINLSITYHSFSCFDFLANDKNANRVILNYNTILMKCALNNGAYSIVYTMIKNDLYKLNATISRNKSILDHYYEDINLKNRKYIIIFLEFLGAKRYNSY